MTCGSGLVLLFCWDGAQTQPEQTQTDRTVKAKCKSKACCSAIAIIQRGKGHSSTSITMDEDPDDLAAAFFAQQAAKEAKKTALPTKDWIRVIHDTTNNTTGEADAEKWLATTLPEAQVDSDNSKGIVGIILNSDSCSLAKNNDSVKEDDEHEKIEMRDKIKQLLLQNIESNLIESNRQKLDR
jgi:hypothetical protein